MGNQTFIRATKFTGLVAQLLKQGQPGIYLILSTAVDGHNVAGDFSGSQAPP